MTPGEFIAKWRASELKESSAAQSHFNDLCQLLGEPTPTDADPTGDWYCFERGARKDTGGDGWADVWKRGCFAWEYKGKHANLDTAFRQLRQYALALENPPLLIVSDMARFAAMQIHYNRYRPYSRTRGANLILLDRTGGGYVAGPDPGGTIRCAGVKGKPGEGMTPGRRRKSSVRRRPNPYDRSTCHVRSNLPIR